MYPENRHGRVHSAPWRRPPRPALGSRPGTWPGPPACPRRRSIAGADSACYPSTRSIAEAPGVEWRCGRRTRRNRRSGCSSSSKPGGPGTRSGRRSSQASSFPGETRRRPTAGAEWPVATGVAGLPGSHAEQTSAFVLVVELEHDLRVLEEWSFSVRGAG